MRLKKIVFGIVALLGAVVLVACGGSTTATKTETETVEYQMFMEDKTDIRYHIEYQGDKVTSVETQTTFLYSALGINSKEEAEQFMGSQESLWTGVKGVNYKVDYKDDRMIAKSSMDLSEIDLEKMMELMQIEETDEKKTDYLSYKEIKKMIDKMGMEKVEDGKFKELK